MLTTTRLADFSARGLADFSARGLACAALLVLASGFGWPGRTERLIAELHAEGDAERRGDLVKLLASVGTREAQQSLVEACSDKQASVRVEAVLGLGRSEAPALEVMRAMLADGVPSVRAAAVSALAMAGDTESQERLVRALGDEEPAVRAASARALAALGLHEASAALGTALSDPSSEVASSAAEALCQLGGAEAEAQLASRFASLPGEVQSALLAALTNAPSQLAQRPASAALESDRPELVRAGLQLVLRHRLRASLPAVEALRTARDPEVARAAELASTMLSEPGEAKAAKPATPLWLPALIKSAERDLSELEAEAVLAQLERLLPAGEQLAGDPLAEWLPRAPVRYAARIAALLAHSQARVNGEPLWPLLARRDPALRAALCEVLAHTGQEKLGPRLLPLLDDAEPAVRVAAARALGALADAAVSLDLVEQLREIDELPATRRPRVAQALALATLRVAKRWDASDRRRVRRTLREALATDDEETAAYLTRSLALLDPAAASELLRAGGSALSPARRVALLRASVGDSSPEARKLRSQHAQAREPSVAATALSAQLFSDRSLSLATLLTMLANVRWPLGPIAAFGLNRSLVQSGEALDPAPLCELLASAREPLTAHNLQLALGKLRAECPNVPNPDGELATPVRQTDTQAQAAATFRALVLDDQSVLVSATDAAGDASWPLLHTLAEHSAWALPYRSNH